ncbi:hypothetical protein [Novosphingobium sp. JCM 18896]|uniref:hypothetical protein n=1 Tax=Novosphingobium sp. JCM 18896 TaxID=2989731 RepID=UPI0022234D50|nr:hypothetical protein [Novosphingobium sp. JCM 18896]MCW1430658.1 hypothetical protein [Novosphingobium sp. JCM 18896]
MKVLAIGSAAKAMSDEDRKRIMPSEVPHTLQLYLDGKLEHFWFRQDVPGVAFVFNAETVDEVKVITDAMPLVIEGFLSYEFQPIGPLRPLGLLLPDFCPA